MSFVKIVLDKSPYNACGSFGSQCHSLIGPVFEFVHFLLDNVGFPADRAREKILRFKKRRPDFLITKTRED